MARHPSSRRVHRETDETEDIVIARMVEASSWARSHARILIVAGIVAVVAVGAVLYVNKMNANKRDTAAIRLLEIRQTAASGNFALAAKDLQSFVDRFGGTPSEGEARLLLGQIQLSQNQPQDAIEAVRPVAASGDRNDIIHASAGLLLGAAYEMANDLQKAEQTYLDVSKAARLDFQRNEALEDAARLRVARGDTAGAIQIYDQLVADAPEGPQRDVYLMRRAELDTAAGAARAS